MRGEQAEAASSMSLGCCRLQGEANPEALLSRQLT